jgi:hypothetical protein
MVGELVPLSIGLPPKSRSFLTSLICRIARLRAEICRAFVRKRGNTEMTRPPRANRISFGEYLVQTQVLY